MKTRTTALAAVLAAAMIGVAGCSATPAPAPETTASVAPVVDSPPASEAGPNDVMPSVFSPGEFYFVSADNVVGKFKIPGDPVPRFEALRKAAGIAPVSYLTVKLDARQATGGANMYQLDLFDPAGKKYTFTSGALSDWLDQVDTDDTTLYNRFVDASNAEAYYVDQAEVGTIVMTSKSTTLPTEITRVAVQANGAFDTTEAYPVSMGQGLDLDF